MCWLLMSAPLQDAMLREFQAEIARLKAELAEASELGSGAMAAEGGASAELQVRLQEQCMPAFRLPLPTLSWLEDPGSCAAASGWFTAVAAQCRGSYHQGRLSRCDNK